MREREFVETIVIGGGQAGLSVGYHLKKRGLPFTILDAGERIGDAWRNRWDSLRVFTPARFCGLDGMPFPAPRHHFPTKDELADYVEAYAKRFDLPVRTGTRVRRLWREGGRFVIDTGGRLLEADQVVVAMSDSQQPKMPAFAQALGEDVAQLHSLDYRRPSQVADGDVLIVGAGNSGAEIALDLAARHHVYISGRDVGHIPFRIGGLLSRLILARLVLRVLFHRVLSVSNPLGRKARPGFLSKGRPLVRTRPRELTDAGVIRVPRTVGVRDGRPLLEDGRVLDVRTVVWCTGFRPGFPEWIDLPVLDGDHPVQRSGIVQEQPGLYFVGLLYLHAVSSEMIHGVGRDAERIARAIEGRGRAAARVSAEAAVAVA